MRALLPLASALILVPVALGSCAGVDESPSPVPGTSTTSSPTTATGTTTTHGVGGHPPLPDAFTVTGVVTDGKDPVEGALVMQGGGPVQMTTGADGRYTLAVVNGPGIPTLVAGKVGYRSAGVELLDLPTGDVELAMVVVKDLDNTAFLYDEPGTGDPAQDTNTQICGHCHTSYVRDFRESGHADAAKNGMVQDLYAGVAEAVTDEAECLSRGGAWRTGLVPGQPSASTWKCYLGVGVLPDLNPGCGAPGGKTCDDPALDPAQRPTAFGRCADCHAAGMNGPVGGRSLHEAEGIAFESGNHCDFCHHIKDVDLGRPPGVGGAILLQRPSEKETSNPGDVRPMPLQYGPEPDSPNGFMGGSYQPRFQSSDFCGACHEQKQEALVPGTALDPVRWPDGLPTHSTYSEWTASGFGATGATCQFCHMPPDDHGLTNSVDTSKPETAGMTDGFPRRPDQLRKHTFREPLDGTPRMIDGTVSVELAAAPSSGQLQVTVKVKNFAVGHAVPSGEPMRSLLLVVEARACGASLPATSGMTLDDWGGALAEGVVGQGVSVGGAQLGWAGAGAALSTGRVVRVVRPTGAWADYPGVGFFADPTLTAAEKGMEIHAPVGEATITAVNGSTATLSQPLAAQAGDVVMVGETLSWPLVDGATSAALAGRAGWSFARTLVDAAGKRGVPHHRAVDMVSDNRLMPGATATTTHGFALPAGCSTAEVAAALVYRPAPFALARERGWEAQDFVVAQGTTVAALP